MLRSALFVTVAMASLTACINTLPEPIEPPASAFGPMPVYIDSVDAFTITAADPRDITDGRGFAVRRDTLFIVDYLLGIHVIDNRTPETPTPLAFISIPGVETVTVVGDFLYANNYTTLVTLDVSTPENATVVDREPDFYPRPPDQPENYLGFFECYDPIRGFLAGWRDTTLTDPQCLLR